MEPKKGQTWTGTISGLPMRIIDVTKEHVEAEVERRMPNKGGEPTIVTRTVTIPLADFRYWADAYKLEGQ